MTADDPSQLVDEIIERASKLALGDLVFVQIFVRRLVEKKWEGLL